MYYVHDCVMKFEITMKIIYTAKHPSALTHMTTIAQLYDQMPIFYILFGIGACQDW